MAYEYAPGFGDAAADAALRETNAQLAEGVALSIDPTKGKKYKTAKAASGWALGQLNRAVEALNRTKVGRAIRSGGNAAADMLAMVEAGTRGDFKADSDGAFEIAKHATAVIGSFTNFLQNLGVSGVAMQEIRDWTAITATCTVGVMVPPHWLGAVACGLTALAKVLSYALGGKPPTQADRRVPRAILDTQDAAARAVIIADSMRLARVLRTVYGVPNYKALLGWLGTETEELDELYALGPPYPPEPAKSEDGSYLQPELQNYQPGLPAHDLRTILQMMSYEVVSPAARLGNMRDGLAVLAAYRTNIEPAGRGLYRRLNVDHDVSQTVIGNGAFFGRAAIAGYGSSTTKYILALGGNTDGWGRGTPLLDGIVANWRRGGQVDWIPFIRVDELINFFGAITRQELARARTSRTVLTDLRLGKSIPVRQMYVRRTDRSGQPIEDGGSAIEPSYDQQCATNLQRAYDTNPCGEGFFDAQSWLAAWQQDGFKGAAGYREVGAMRLKAAFSFLHLQYRWTGIDPIEQAPTDDEMATPVDPRQVVAREPGLYSLRPDGAGDFAGATVSKYARYWDARYGVYRVEPRAGETQGATVLPLLGNVLVAASDAPTMQGDDVYRNSRLDPIKLSALIDAHSVEVEEAIRRTRDELIRRATTTTIGTQTISTDTMKAIVAAINRQATKVGSSAAMRASPLTTAQFSLTAAQIAARKAPVPAPVAPAPSGSNAPLLIGAAALLFLLLR